MITGFRARVQTSKILLLLGAVVPLGALPAGAAGMMTYEGSEYFTVTPFDWVVNVKIDEISSTVVSLVEVFKDGGDVTDGLLQGNAEIGALTTPALAAQRSPVDTSPAGGRARVIDTLENIGDASGYFTGNLGDRLRINATSEIYFDLAYDGPESDTETDAVICLMPIQLAVIRGTELEGGQAPARATYRYYFEIDGDEIFSSSVSLTESAGSVSLTAPDGALRTDGVYFEDVSRSTYGYNFPAATFQVPMGLFESGDPLEAVLRFETIIEAPDNNWGAYAGPSSALVSPNLLIPITAVPEPQVAGFLAAGLLLATRRRAGGRNSQGQA